MKAPEVGDKATVNGEVITLTPKHIDSVVFNQADDGYHILIGEHSVCMFYQSNQQMWYVMGGDD